MNTLSNDPTETAAVLHGILAGPIAPTVDQRAAMDVPALVIGHQVDRIHPFHDAEQLARRLPQGQLVQANSVLELRVHPERLTGEIGTFLDEAWADAGAPCPTGGLSHLADRVRPPAADQSSRSGRRFRLRSESWRLAARRRSLAPREGRVGAGPSPRGGRRPSADGSAPRPAGGCGSASARRPPPPGARARGARAAGPAAGDRATATRRCRSAAPPGCSPCWRAGRPGRRWG